MITKPRQEVASANSAVPGFIAAVGGSDGTNLRAFKVDSAGVGAVTATVNNAVSGVVSVSGTVNITNVATVTTVQSCTVYQGTSPWIDRPQNVATASSAVPLFAGLIGGTDGTNILGLRANASGVIDIQGVATTASAVPNRAMFVGGTDGTNIRALALRTGGDLRYAATSTSAIPALANMVGFSDGTNLYPGVAISSATVASANTQTRGVLGVSPLNQWVRFSSAAANSKCVATRTAITGAYNVIMGFSYGMACGTASSTLDSVSVTHGAAGTVSVFTIGPGRCPPSDSRYFSQENLGWVASLFTAVNVEFQASAPASGFQYATIWGYTLPS